MFSDVKKAPVQWFWCSAMWKRRIGTAILQLYLGWIGAFTINWLVFCWKKKLGETIDFPIKYGVFSVVFLQPIHWPAILMLGYQALDPSPYCWWVAPSKNDQLGRNWIEWSERSMVEPPTCEFLVLPVGLCSICLAQLDTMHLRDRTSCARFWWLSRPWPEGMRGWLSLTAHIWWERPSKDHGVRSRFPLRPILYLY